jgi:hypothetical protein
MSDALIPSRIRARPHASYRLLSRPDASATIRLHANECCHVLSRPNVCRCLPAIHIRSPALRDSKSGRYSVSVSVTVPI